MPKIKTFVWEKWQKWTWQLEVKWKLFYGGALRRTSNFFLLERGYLKLSFLDYAVLNNLLASEIGSTKVRILYFFHILFYIFSCNLKTTKLTKLSYTSLKSWLKTFRTSIYMLNKIPVKLEILASKVDHSADKNDLRFLPSFDFEGPC